LARKLQSQARGCGWADRVARRPRGRLACCASLSQGSEAADLPVRWAGPAGTRPAGTENLMSAGRRPWPPGLHDLGHRDEALFCRSSMNVRLAPTMVVTDVSARQTGPLPKAPHHLGETRLQGEVRVQARVIPAESKKDEGAHASPASSSVSAIRTRTPYAGSSTPRRSTPRERGARFGGCSGTSEG